MVKDNTNTLYRCVTFRFLFDEGSSAALAVVEALFDLVGTEAAFAAIFKASAKLRDAAPPQAPTQGAGARPELEFPPLSFPSVGREEKRYHEWANVKKKHS